MRDLTVRLTGTACFVDGGNDDPFRKRLVLPVDRVVQDPQKKHIPYVEFPAEGVTAPGGGLSEKYTHFNGFVEYRRFVLDGHVVTISDVNSDPLTVFDSYDNHVAKMTLVEPSLDQRPRSECFAAYPDGTVIAGFFDLSDGLLKAGRYYEFITRFRRPRSGVETTRLQTCEEVELLLRVTTAQITVTFTKAGQTPVQVIMDATADKITIGNEPLADITGGGSGYPTDEHFKIYYDLADPANRPLNGPLPERILAPLNSCTVTNWP